jgi:hypothetical protein
MNYGGENPLEKGYGKYIKDSDSQAPGRDIFNPNNGNSVAILAQAPTKKTYLDPIRSGKSPY